jgi:hypothetical protein
MPHSLLFPVSSHSKLNFQPLSQDDIFEWHFVIRGPPDTEFEVRGALLSQHEPLFCVAVVQG